MDYKIQFYVFLIKKYARLCTLEISKDFIKHFSSRINRPKFNKFQRLVKNKRN